MTFVCVRQHINDVRSCPCVSVSTHRTYVAVHQYTYQHVGPWNQHAGHPVDCLGDIGPRGCPSAHTGHPWVSVSRNRMSVSVCQHTLDVCGCVCVSVCVHVCPSAHTGRPWLSVSTHRTSVCVRQHTQDVCVSVSTHRSSVAVRVCPSAHTGRLWLSISTHISTLVLGLSTLALPVDCSGDFGPRGLSVQYTQDIRGCPSAHTGCPCVSVSTHRSSVAVRVCPSAHRGHPCVSVSTHKTSMGVRQHTQDVCGCLWLSVSLSLIHI